MKTGFALAMVLVLAACSGGSGSTQPSGKVKIGKPYVIDGRTYYPSYDATYDKIGDASWYGPGFHGKSTANGERFNQDDLTAAHPTLPMPSLVRVTNLENGKSAIIRINDRGPFKKDRIIDLSKASAQKLGVHSIHKVRVQFLREETEQYIASLQGGNKPTMTALNNAEEDEKNDSLIASTQPSSQIVESTVADTQPGQTVGSAAPVMTVSSDDLEGSSPRSVTGSAYASSGGSIQSYDTPRLITANPSETGTRPVVLRGASDQEAAAAELAVAEKPQQYASLSAPAPAKALPSSGGGYAIQAGSFASEANANKLAGQLRNLSGMKIDAYVDKVDMNGRQWWRVRGGPFADKSMADQALNIIRENGVAEARIVHQ